MRWVKDDNPQSQINSDPNLAKNGKTAAQNRWIAYNKGKGQYSSVMEHKIPEQAWVDKSQCRYTDENGVIQNPSKADCAQGISAVKAIAIAQSQGQKIYTINPKNRDTALPKLSLAGSAGEEIRSAISAGKEVTFHESAINAYGWHGVGYIITDIDTGAGAYLIEGGGNGGYFLGIIIGTLLAIFIGSLLIEISIVVGLLLFAYVFLLSIAWLFQVGARDAAMCKKWFGAAIGQLLGALGAAMSAISGALFGIISGTMTSVMQFFDDTASAICEV